MARYELTRVHTGDARSTRLGLGGAGFVREELCQFNFLTRVEQRVTGEGKGCVKLT